MRFLCIAAIFAGATLTLSAQPPDAARVLADMRQALGGDTALRALKTFSIGGTNTRDMGERTIQFGIELLCELPDKCARVSRQLGVPVETVVSDGYNGDEPVHEMDARIPLPPFPGPPDTPESIARRRAGRTARNKEDFARYTVVLLGAALPVYPLDFTFGGPDALDGRAMEAIDIKGAGAFAARLLIDAQSHLPAALTWKTPPIVMMATSSVVTTRRSTGEVTSSTPPAIENPRKVPPGAVAVTSTPTPSLVASLPLVERRRVFSDFKETDGLMWPRRIREYADGQLAEDFKIGSVKVNPKIDPKRFTPEK